MRKRILSLFLCFVLLISSVPVQVFAAGEYSSDWEFTEGTLVTGDNTVAMVAGAEYTLIEFYPEETGIYTFEGPAGSKLANFNASFFPNNITGDAAADSLEWTCTSVGQSLLLGICAQGDTVTVNVARTGEYVSNEIQYTVYENTHTPDAANKDYCAKASGKLTPADKLVKKGDRYYTENGEAVFVNFTYINLSISAMLGTSPARYVEKDAAGNVVVAYDYYDALSAYSAMGNYPLTADLEQMLRHLDIAKRWTEDGWLNGWQELCFLVKDHEADEAVVEGNVANTYCVACGKLMKSEEAKPKDPHAFGTQKLAVGSNSVALNAGAVYTLNKFTPSETGVYTFEVPAGSKLANYNTSFNPMDLTGDAASATLEWTCSSVGQHILVGVSGSGESVNVTITRIGDYVSNEIQYVNYVNLHTPSKENTDYCENVGGWFSVPSVVPQGDFFYGVTAEGEYIPMFVDFAYSELSLTSMLETSSAKYAKLDENGNVVEAYNYYDALKAYTAFGKYPLTQDLMQMLQHLDAAKGWTENGWLGGWQELCFLAAQHKEGEPVIEGDLAKYYCTGCNKLLKTEEAPKEEFIAKGVIGDLTWRITNEGTLIVSGEGEMSDCMNDQWEAEFPWSDYAEQINKVVVEAGVTTVGMYAFSGLSNLTEVSLPDGLTLLGGYCFQDCTKLESITIPASVRGVSKDLFTNCVSLKAVNYEEGNANFYSIDGVVFMQDEFGTYVRLYPDAREGASYTVPEGITWISMTAFARCKNLEEVILPSTLTHIGERSFMASGLKTITIPASVEMIKFGAFYGCTELETVYFEGDAPENEGSIFGFDPNLITATCYYPAGNETWTEEARQSFDGDITWIPYGEVEEEIIASGTEGTVNWKVTADGKLTLSGQGEMPDYLNVDTPWKAYADQVTSIYVEEGITVLSNYALAGMTKATEISLPNTLTAMMNGCISGCTSLESITVPASVTMLYSNAFSGDSKLKEILVEEGSTSYTSVDGVLLNADKTEALCYPAGKTESVYTIPEGVTFISNSTFAGCKNLTEVVLPETLTGIFMGAFTGSSIKTVTIPASVTYIWMNAFSNCAELETIRFLGNPPAIDQNAFLGVTADVYHPVENENWTAGIMQNYGGTLNWVYKDQLPEADVVAEGTTGEVNWKLTEEGILTVSGQGRMGDYAIVDENGGDSERAPWYSYADQILMIAVEEGVTYIGSCAFAMLVQASEISLPDSLTDIGYMSFVDMNKLGSIDLPENLQSIGGQAFAGCDVLHTLTIPASVAEIGEGVVRSCDQLVEIIVAEGNKVFEVQDYALVNTETKTLLGYPAGRSSYEGSFIVPEGIKRIGYYAFSVCWFDAIDLPDSLEEIGLYAFEWCNLLTSLTVPANVHSLDTMAFSNFDNGLYNSMEKIVFTGDKPKMGAEVFLGEKLDVHYPVNNPTWTEDALQNYGGTITWIPYGEPATSGACGENATWSLDTETGVLTISGSGAMDNYGYNAEEDVEVLAPWNDYKDSITAIVIEEGITTVGHYAFSHYKNLVSLSLPDGLTVIGYGAFQFCEGLKELTLPDSVTEIGTAAFAFCNSLTELTIPNGITMLNAGTFASCANLTKIVLSDSLVTLDFESFCAHHNLTDVIFGKNITTIGGEVFSFCHGLTSLVIPDSVTTIEAQALFACDNLTSVYVPATVTSIGEGAFVGCPKLTLTVEEGSVAEKYAAENNIPFVVYSDCAHSQRKHVEAQEPTATESGNIEYWTCPDCGTMWRDEELTQVVEPEDVILPALGQPELPGNTAEEYILVEFTMNEDGTAGTATLTVEPGIWYYGAYISGMELTANGEAVEVTPAQSRMPVIFCFTNEGAEAVTYELVASYPLGTMSNPEVLTMGENAAKIEEGNDQGYFFTWTAQVPGTLTVTMPQGNWFYTLSNLTAGIYGDMQYSNSDPVVAAPQLEVQAGDQIQLIVNNFDPANPWATPAGTFTFQASFEKATLALVPVIDAPAEVVKQDDGSYIVYLDKEDVADTVLFSIMAQTLEPITKKDLKWTVSDSRIATVKSDASAPVGNVTLKAGADGVCVITAQNVKTKDVASVTVVIRDYAPRLGSSSLSLNAFGRELAVTELVESYGNIIQSVTLHEAQGKGYAEEPSEQFLANYSKDQLILFLQDVVKKGNHKLLLKATCENGETYEYELTLKVTQTLPSVTVKQLDKLNTFYKDGSTQFLLTSKNGTVTEAVMVENDALVSEFDPATGILTLRLSGNGAALKTKGTLQITFDGYRVPLEKTVTVKTEKKAPKLSLNQNASVINVAVDDEPNTIFNVHGLKETMTVHVEADFAQATRYDTFIELELTEEAITSGKAGTAELYIQAENWIEPIKLTHKVTIQNKMPGITFLPTLGVSPKLNRANPGMTTYVSFRLDQSGVRVAGFTVEPASTNSKIRAEAAKIGYKPLESVLGMEGFFQMWLDPENLPKKGTYEFRVTVALEGSDQTVSKTVKIPVEDKAPVVKFKSKTLKLNQLLGTGATARTEVTIQNVGEGVLYDMVLMEEYQDYRVEFEAQSLIVTLLNPNVETGKKTIWLYPVINYMMEDELIQLGNPVSVNLEVYSGKPSITVAAKGKLDAIVPDSAIVYTIRKLTNISGSPEAVRLDGADAALFDAALQEDGTVRLTLRQGAAVQKNKTYRPELVYTIAGQEVAVKLSVKVSQSNVKLTAPKAVNYYQSQSGRMAVRLVLTAPEGASLESIALSSKTAKQLLDALGQEAITWTRMPDGNYMVSIRVENPAALVAGKTYALQLEATAEGSTEGTKPAAVKVNVKVFK